MKILGVTAKVLFILCLPGLLLFGSLGLVANSSWFYTAEFEKYNVSQTTGLTQAELEKAANGLISYFNSGEEYINLTVIKDGKPFVLFNQREVIHLKDFKGLIQLNYKVTVGILSYVLAYAGVSLFWQKRKHWRQLAWAAVGGSSLTLALMLALGIGSLLNFEQLFLQLHFLVYTNELWMLDPTKDYLIMLVPEGFFFDAALFIGALTSGLAIVLGGVAGGYLVVTRRRAASKKG